MIKLAGTWSFTQGSQTAVGVDTQALTAIFIGDSISIDRDKLYRVLTIASDTSITFEPAFVEATAAGAQGWLLPVSTTRASFGALSAQFTDLRSRYSEVMVVSGADRRITLNKAAVGDFSEIIHQTAGVHKFKTGLIADNEWALQAFINNAWTNVLKTVTTGVSPSQAVSLSYALAIGVGVGTVALPGIAFVGRTDTGLWSPAAATLAASAGGVEVWRSTASLITLAQNLKLSKIAPIFDINAAAAGQARLLRSYTNDVLRWQFDFGDGAAEAGGNAGSDVYLRSYNDAGASIGTALKITRSSMLVTVGAGLTATGAVTVVAATASTSPTTGSLINAGGFGNAGTAFFGGNVTIAKADPRISLNANSSSNPGIEFQIAGVLQTLLFADGTKFYVTPDFSTGMTMTHGASAWAAISDARLPYKKTARKLSMLDRIERFQLYENEVNGRLELFVKAQEFVHVAPHLVSLPLEASGADYTPTGINDPKAWGVSYDRAGVAAFQLGKEIWNSVNPRLEQVVLRLDALERLAGA